jgi:hypothetical protein
MSHCKTVIIPPPVSLIYSPHKKCLNWKLQIFNLTSGADIYTIKSFLRKSVSASCAPCPSSRVEQKLKLQFVQNTQLNLLTNSYTRCQGSVSYGGVAGRHTFCKRMAF